MQIYDELHADHLQVINLLDNLIDLPGEDDDKDTVVERDSLIRQVRDALVPHSRAEERVLYNSLRQYKEGKSPAIHAYREHVEAESLLRALQIEDKISLDWRRTALKLRHALQHHIDEEETTLFGLARNLFNTHESEVMAEEFLRLKNKIRDEGFMGTTLDMMANLGSTRTKKLRKDVHP